MFFLCGLIASWHTDWRCVEPGDTNMATKKKVQIVWNNAGGELDSVVVVDDGKQSVTNAMIAMIKGTSVEAGDTFTVVEVE